MTLTLFTLFCNCSPQGSSHLAACFRILLNEAIQQERSAVLQAKPYERCEGRLGPANGFKPKTLATRMGDVELRILQVRDGIDFYSSALSAACAATRLSLSPWPKCMCRGGLHTQSLQNC